MLCACLFVFFFFNFAYGLSQVTWDERIFFLEIDPFLCFIWQHNNQLCATLKETT